MWKFSWDSIPTIKSKGQSKYRNKRISTKVSSRVGSQQDSINEQLRVSGCELKLWTWVKDGLLMDYPVHGAGRAVFKRA